MIPSSQRKAIADLLRREVVPAIGCTEPMAVALCTARARELLGGLPERIEVLLSANILKNAMGVGIPGTGMIGLPIAVALGAQIGRSECGLEVLRDVTPEAVARARDYLAADAVSVALKEGISETLYVEVHCTAGGRRAEAVIAGSHTRFVYLACDGEVVLDRRTGASSREEEPCVPLTLRRVFDYALAAPIDELAFIDEARRLNMAAAELALGGEYGHSLGRTLRGRRELHVMGDSLFSRMLAYTSAACDARMAGAMVPVMSNSGSGNQGIAATVPVAVYARQTGASEERTRRALVLSHLTAIYIKQSLGRLSALCGCVVAATGSSCGIAYLMGGGYREVACAVQNMIANLTGMICDGAKASCAAKIASAVEAGLLGMQMQMHESQFYGGDGIVVKGVENTIRNIGTLASEGMRETDRTIIRMMIQEH